jgi:hypothetical protein
LKLKPFPHPVSQSLQDGIAGIAIEVEVEIEAVPVPGSQSLPMVSQASLV